jgi:UDP-glucose:(heptosyl)LPS alpha-1,3-glucosyltransferase
MKICLVMSSINTYGGVSNYVSGLARELVKKHEVHFITSKYEIPITGTVAHTHNIIWNPTSLQVASNAIMNVHDIVRLHKKIGFDIIHSQGAESYVQDIICAQSCQKAAVEHLRNTRGGMYRFLKPFEPTNNIVQAIEKHNYRRRKYQKIISVAQGVKEEIIFHYGVPEDDIVVIPNGVNLEEFKPANREIYRKAIRNHYGLLDDDIVLLLTAWEFKRKGVRYVIEALSKLPKEVKFMIVGGDDQTPYKNLADKLGVKDRVIFAGFSKNVKEYYAAADLFVFPTEYEAFSLSTLEAVACGLPLIATKVNGTEELIKDGVNGFFILQDGDDIAGMVKAVLDYGISKMGVNARYSALNYSWEKVAEETGKVYQEVLE